MKIDAYGKLIQVIRKDQCWYVFYLGNEGKKRLAEDIKISPDTDESEIPGVIADLCHEWAKEGHREVFIVKS